MIIDQMHLSDLIFPHKELPENEEHVVRDLRVHDHLSNLDPAVEISPDSRKKRPSQQPGSSVKVSLIIKNCVRKNLDYLSGAIRIPLLAVLFAFRLRSMLIVALSRYRLFAICAAL